MEFLLREPNIIIYCRTGFIRLCFYFAQMTVDEFKTRLDTHSHIEYIVCIVTGRFKKMVEIKVIHERAK